MHSVGNTEVAYISVESPASVPESEELTFDQPGEQLLEEKRIA